MTLVTLMFEHANPLSHLVSRLNYVFNLRILIQPGTMFSTGTLWISLSLLSAWLLIIC